MLNLLTVGHVTINLDKVAAFKLLGGGAVLVVFDVPLATGSVMNETIAGRDAEALRRWLADPANARSVT